MKRYDQIFTLEVDKSKEEIIHILEKKEHVTIHENAITINHNPPWYKVFSGRGIVTLNPGNTGSNKKTIMQCVLSPSLADARTIIVFLLWNIPLWAALIYFFPWNILLAVVFFIEWLIMAFIAIPVLFITLLISSVYLLYISFSGPIIFFVVIKWCFFLLLVNAAMRYNRGELKKWVVQQFGFKLPES